MGHSDIQNVGVGLASVLPVDSMPWYQHAHLLKLNLCALSLMMFSSATGFDGSLMNGLQALTQWTTFMKQPAGAWLGFINAIYWVSVGITSPIVTRFATKFGRKPCLYFGFVALVIATAIQSSAPNSGTFIAGRALLGISTAAFGNAAPLLVAEVSHPTHRSVLTTMYPSGFYIGSIVAAWAVFGTRNYGSHWAWRLPSLLQVVFPMIGVIGTFLSPESPRWLISVGRVDEARQILIDCHAGGDVSSPLVAYEMTSIQNTLEADKVQGQARYSDMLKTKGNRHRLFITVSLGFYAQWIGNGVVSYYLALVLTTVGITSVTNQTLISGCLQIWNLIFAVGSACCVDKLGRRVLFMASFVIMFIAYVIITGLSGSFAMTGKASVGVTVIPFLFIFFSGYNLALTNFLLSYPVEIWPYHLRSHGLSVVWVTTVVAIVFNVFVNPIALAAIGWKYYIVFVVVLLAYGFTVYLAYPETRGHTLEDMSVVFDGKDAATFTEGYLDSVIVDGDGESKERSEKIDHEKSVV